MYSSKIVLLVFIFLAVWWGSVNTAKVITKDDIPFVNFIVMAVGIVGIIAYYI